MNAGSSDIDAAVDALRSRLPEPLAPLADLAYNYRWSWTPGGPELLSSVDPRRWELCLGNPVRLIEETAPSRLAELARDDGFLARLADLHGTVTAKVSEPRLTEPVTEDSPAAFFCAEYAIHKSLPVYSGGLGVLAGDILKEASDMGLPLVAVGLMYRHGYFRQRIDASGWQHEYWVETDPERMPAALINGDDGTPLCVEVPIGERTVVAQVWRVNVGRVPLLLLDADRPENDLTDRWITSRLYVGDPGVRLGQYALLGIGGVRALDALGIEPGVVHLNEGHAAMACLELARTARLRDRPPAHRVHHAHAGAGRQRHLPGRADGRGAGRHRVRDGRRSRRARPPRPHASGGERGAVRRHPVRAALEPDRQRGQRPPRRGRARDVAGAVARPRRSRTCRSRT